jgi:hypothetical protein
MSEASKEALDIADWYTVTAKDRCSLALAIDALCAEARRSGYSHGWSDRAAIDIEREYILTSERDRLLDLVEEAIELQRSWYGHATDLHMSMITWADEARAALKEVSDVN